MTEEHRCEQQQSPDAPLAGREESACAACSPSLLSERLVSSLAEYARSNMALANSVALLTATVSDLLGRLPQDDLDAGNLPPMSREKGRLKER